MPDGTTHSFGDGDGPGASVTVLDEAVFGRVLLHGETAAGEAFMDGLWQTDDLPGLVRLYLRCRDELRLGRVIPWLARGFRRQAPRNSRAGSLRNVRAHYDLGNDFYRLFLDPSLTYSCALWEPGDDLELAQARKCERICEALELGPGDRVLEIGCGWGALAMHAARTRGCRVTGITLSREQLALSRSRAREAGLGDRVQLELRDYRDVSGTYDKIVSIEMFEGVGEAYWDDYFRACARALLPGGRMLLQTIVLPDDRFVRYRDRTDWTQKHVFPGVVIPSRAALTRSIERATRLRVRSVTRIGPHYAPTLRAWRERFLANRAQAARLGKDERFLRMWEMYLAFSEASFAEGTLDDLQVLIE